MPGFPIARITDLGAHADVMVQGAATVRANGLPVHRMLDIHACPILGVGVTIANCSTTVRVESIPAAHVGSIGLCAMVLPTTIVSGSPNVSVGA